MASDKVAKLIEEVKNLTVLELSKLVKALEEEFGVSAAAPVAVAVAPTGDAAPAVEEKTEFSVVLTEIGDNKMSVIKLVKEVTGFGLKESKELVEGAPKPVKEGIAKAEAEDVKAKFEAAGAKIELK